MLLVGSAVNRAVALDRKHVSPQRCRDGVYNFTLLQINYFSGKIVQGGYLQTGLAKPSHGWVVMSNVFPRLAH